MSVKDVIDNFLPNEKVADITQEFSDNSYWEWYPYISKFRYCKAFPVMLGYDPENLPSGFSEWFRIVHPEDREQVINSLRLLIKKQEPASFECRLRSQAWEWNWIHTRIRSCHESVGKKGIRLIGVNTRIDREKQFQADLELNKERLKMLLQSLNQGILLEDQDRKIIYANRFFKRMFGIPADLNITGLDCRMAAEESALLFKDPRGFVEGIDNCFNLGEPVFSQQLVLSDGRIFERDFLPIGGKSAEAGSYWIYRDVTDKNALEKKINEASEQNLLMAELGLRLISSDTSDQIFRFMFNQLKAILPGYAVIIVKAFDEQSSGIFDYQLPGNRLFSRVLELFGPDIKNRVFQMTPDTEYLYNPLMLNKVKGGLAELIAPLFPKSVVSQVKRLMPDRDVYTIGISFNNDYYGNINIIAPDKEYRLNKSLIEAITYQCALALSQLYGKEKLIDAREKAEEGNRMKSAFLANISHEIRTPMNGIVGFADLLRTPGLDESKKLRYINIINSNAELLLKLINDILDISRIESGDKSLINEKVNIDAVFSELTNMFELNRNGTELIFNNEQVPAVLADRVKLTQVLSNLVGNALKFTSRGVVKCSACIEGSDIRFSVEDTGSGITEKDQQVIFERFVQGKHKIWLSQSGAGLGLSIAKAYVEMMGGSIWFESTWGKGSTFYFTIPFRQA
jgi:signal transduction histidine kinase